MVGAGSMTEPNVLGNISAAKFLWENGNTEIINLWRSSNAGGDLAMNAPSAGTQNGVNYVVPAARVFYLLSFTMIEGSDEDIEIQKDTLPNTTNGTTLWKSYHLVGGTTLYNNPQSMGYCKFVAGEYVNINQVGGGTMFCIGWGVECDA